VYLIRVIGPAFMPFNHFGYFTVLSNILAAVVFAVGVFRPVPPLIRGGAVVYMVTTGLVYAVLLRGVDVQTPAYANVVLHVVMPILVAADWLLDPPAAAPMRPRALRWLLIPVVYVIYTLIRGPIVDWYPYPFLDPRRGGYGTVAVMAAGVAVTIAALAWLVAWVGNRSGNARAVRRDLRADATG
jgi:hypothetical protein